MSESKVKLNFYLNKDEHKEIKDICNETGLKVQDLCRISIRNLVNDYKNNMELKIVKKS